ncbi:M24 family metallopeptidase [Chloroflexota bacterium]
MGEGMDLSWIEKPHEYEPRRLYSNTGADWQMRIDFDRMRRERLQNTLDKMEEHDIDALVVFQGENVRYITNVYQGNWKYNIAIRYAVLPRGGKPVLFETAGSDMQCAKIDAPWLEGRIRPAITWRWSEGAEEYMADRMAQSVYDVLKENGVEKGKVGMDLFDYRTMESFKKLNVNVTSAWPVMSGARVVKTADEIECIKMSTAFGDAAMWKIKYEWLKPGVTEAFVNAKVAEYLYEHGGFEHCYDIIVASGGNTSPYRRWHTDKLIRNGDLVIVDINATGPGGYFVDFVRCFKVGGKWNQKQKDLYKEVYDSMHAGMEMLKPGNTSKDVAEKFPVYDDDKYGTVTLQQFAHSIGLSLYEGMWVSRSYSLKYPAEIKQNMTFAIETFAGHPGLTQTCRLEEDVVVTPDGAVPLTMMEYEEECVG